MSNIFKEYAKITWQTRWTFLLVLFGITVATVLNIYVPVFISVDTDDKYAAMWKHQSGEFL